MNEARAYETISRVLRLSRAPSTYVGMGADQGSATRLADNVITQNVRSEGAWLSVECAWGRKHGSASTNDLSDGSLKDVVRRAEEIAKASPPDPEFMPLIGRDEAKKYLETRRWFPRTLELTPLDKARHLVAAVRKVKSRGLRVSGAYSTSGWIYAIGNSAGLRGFTRSTSAEIHLTALGKAGSGWAQELAEDAGEMDPVRVAAEAADIGARAQKPSDLPAGKYTVIMRPAATAELLSFLIYGLDAKATDEGHTFMRGKLGKKVFGGNFTLRSDPADPRCPGGPFHGDGMATRAIDWIRNGTVENLAYSRYWAKKKNKKPTWGPENVIVDGEGKAVDEMIASTERGLLITRFWYIRTVDPMVPSVTGMTRDGLFLIENGRIKRPVKNMRFNENLVDMLNRVEATGEPQKAGEWSGFLVPALQVRDFNFTSTTKF